MRVAVVGSGPSGVYTADSLLRSTSVPDVAVDVLDRLPCPYGLVRYGVAPDHEKIKSLQGALRRVLEEPSVRFVGNVAVGLDAPGPAPADLLRLYHAVVYCVGAATDRQLGVPGEELAGSFPATRFVSWYSAHPDAPHERFPLDTDAAVVVGVGNVAVDVTRMLARGAAELRRTDVPEAALRALAGSRIRDVYMVGRRGPSQAKFTTKELRELGLLPDTEVVVDPEELALDPYVSGRADPAALSATARRNLEVLRGWADRAPADHAVAGDRGRRIHLRFYLRPEEITGAGGRVTGVRFERTVPDGDGGVRGTGRTEWFGAGLVLRSVGYRGAPPAGLPFDAERGVVPNEGGRVLRDGRRSPGEYVAGWIKRGPTGVIGSNRPCAKETVAALLADADELRGRPLPGDPLAGLRALGASPVGWPGWQAIEAAERELGRRLERGPVKIPDWPGLLAAAKVG
nr:NADP oxidoreductase [Streptomyces sp. SID5468]